MLQLPITSLAADTTAVPCTPNRCIALFPGHVQILYHMPVVLIVSMQLTGIVLNYSSKEKTYVFDAIVQHNTCIAVIQHNIC